MNKITTIAIDLAKRVFEVLGVDRHGRELLSIRLHSRDAFDAFLLTLVAPLLVVMEVGLGSQAWARKLAERGITVRLLPAKHVKAHRCGQKNDRNDVRAILRASRDENIHAVPLKSTQQLAMQALHRARQGWVRRKTALSNQIRGLLLEHNVTMAKGDKVLQDVVPKALEAASVPLPDLLRDVVAMLWSDWEHQVEQIEVIERPIRQLAREDATARRIDGVLGIGPITATALACKGFDVNDFANARQFPAYFGVVPSQYSSGERICLGKMTRQGDGYIRALVISGAQSVIRCVKKDDQSIDAKRIRRWVDKLGRKQAAVRLANRNLRIVWSLLKNQSDFERNHRAPPKASESVPANKSMEATA